jgi:hypothetical protein
VILAHSDNAEALRGQSWECLCDCIPLEDVQEVRRTGSQMAVNDSIEPFARLIALSHPIDVAMQISG